jgi:hypothetical protein
MHPLELLGDLFVTFNKELKSAVQTTNFRSPRVLIPGAAIGASLVLLAAKSRSNRPEEDTANNQASSCA